MPRRDGALSTLSVPPAPERSSLFKDELFVGGEWVPAADDARLEVLDPAAGSPIVQVASAALL